MRSTLNYDEGWPLVARDAEPAAVLAKIVDGLTHDVLPPVAPGSARTRLARAVLEALKASDVPVPRINANASGVPLAAPNRFGNLDLHIRQL